MRYCGDDHLRHLHTELCYEGSSAAQSGSKNHAACDLQYRQHDQEHAMPAEDDQRPVLLTLVSVSLIKSKRNVTSVLVSMDANLPLTLVASA